MANIDKKALSEQDIRTKYVTPAIEEAGWDKMRHFREEYTFTAGRVVVKGKVVDRGEQHRVDYLLYCEDMPEFPLAVVEAKDNNHEISDGMQQALNYAKLLHIPFVFTSNGDGFAFHDRTGTGDHVETILDLNSFPSPEHLYRRYCRWKGLDDAAEKVIRQEYYVDHSGRRPRYYQVNAINRTVEAIAKGQDRILLVMATGTGKTYTAFQIIWRLWKSGVKKRILFLADRNVLVDQTMVNDFKPFKGAMAKLSTKTKTIERGDGSKENVTSAINKRTRKIDTAYEIYLSLYQAITGPQEAKKVYKQFSPDFFDLIVIDECHRGSAAEDSEWREILEYFAAATQIGMTATPKETETVSNMTYFGKPVYKYSLKQGIADGFLAPYKVIRVRFDKDDFWRPEIGKVDKHGQPIPDRVYNQKDYDRNLIMEKRNARVAERVVEFLESTDPYAKTIIFCEDIAHAERMRFAISNAAPDRVRNNSRYVMKITSDDKEGKDQLDNFIHPEERYPVIATTSRLLSTGVDAKTCRLIVLDREINSMTEFKQIIGRGTRIDEDYDKLFFTIMDFRNATRKFADPDFDGEPVVIYEPTEDDEIVPPDDLEEPEEGEDNFDDADGSDLPPDIGFPNDDGSPSPQKLIIDDVEFSIAVEQVSYVNEDGKLVTESLRDFTRRTVTSRFAKLEAFLADWSSAEQKSAIIAELEEHGVSFDMLHAAVGNDFDPFDLICHVAYDQPPLTRHERAANVQKQNYFGQYGDQARAVLSALLDKYTDQGIRAIEDIDVLRVQPFSEMGSLVELIGYFGGADEFRKAIRELAQRLYGTAV